MKSFSENAKDVLRDVLVVLYLVGILVVLYFISPWCAFGYVVFILYWLVKYGK